MHLVGAGFRYVPVLAEEAAHVASGRAHREDPRARKKMVERLFLDGVDLQRGRTGVAEAVELAAPSRANEAESGLPVADVTMPRTEIAVEFSSGPRLPPASFVE